jgi:hypothetical protein
VAIGDPHPTQRLADNFTAAGTPLEKGAYVDQSSVRSVLLAALGVLYSRIAIS